MDMWSKFFNKAWPFILLALMGVALWDSCSRAKRYQKQSETLETTITDMNQQVKQTKIKLNDSITLYQAEVKSLNYTADNLKAKYNALLQASSLKAKDVAAITEVTARTTSIDTIIAEVDTFGGMKARLQDHFVKISVDIAADRKAVIDYDIRDSLSVISVQKRHSLLFGLIKWTSTESTRVINHNPKAHITSLQTINVIE